MLNQLFGQDLVGAVDLCQGIEADEALDINMGQKILVRLRPDNAPDTFLPEESIVGTMLHEVCIHCPQQTSQKSKFNSSVQSIYLVNT